MKKKILLLVLALVLAFSMSTVAFADFGDFAGGSDWGGSDFGGWDSGYDSWDSGYDSWDSGYSDNYYYYDGGDYSSDGDIGGMEIIITVIVIAIILGSIAGSRNIKKSSVNRRVNVPRQQAETLVNDVAGLKRRDPAFSESKFLGEVSNLYVRFQDAWSARDLTDVRPHLTEELYAKSDRQVKGYIQRGQTNHVERVSVLSANIVGCTCDSKNDIVTVEILSRICDYVTDDRTGNVIRGDMNRELFMTYRWTFIRTLGKLTAEDEIVDDKKCPNCGAPLDLNRSAVCEYCGSVVTSGEYGWVVSDIKGISQVSA
ncbi:MAG: TIM44-like domain-containing protein [Oscillospiraceae bacterium]|nr:TIM44-like domain-containing protein [Oscillospiraceae bacterium]